MLIGAQLILMQARAANTGVEEQLSQIYSLTKVAADGSVVQPGIVLVARFFGIKANPVSGDIYWPNSYKKGGRIGQPMFFAKSGVSKVVNETRFLMAGEKVYVTNIEAKDADVVFSLQTCGGGAAGRDPNGLPYRARVTFQFQKAFVSTANIQAIQSTIAELLAIAPSDNTTTAEPSKSAAPPEAKLGKVYVSRQNSGDRLQLDGTGSFSLAEGGQTFTGTYSVVGTTLRLHIVQLQKDVDIAIQGDQLLVNGEEAWVQPAR